MIVFRLLREGYRWGNGSSAGNVSEIGGPSCAFDNIDGPLIRGIAQNDANQRFFNFLFSFTTAFKIETGTECVEEVTGRN